MYKVTKLHTYLYVFFFQLPPEPRIMDIVTQMIPSSNRRSVGQGVSANPNLSAVPEDNEANESLIQTDSVDAAHPVRVHP